MVYPALAVALIALLRRRDLRPLGIGVAIQSLLMGCWWAWEGGWCAGPRMLAEAVSFLGKGLAVAAQSFPGWRPRAWPLAAYALAATGRSR